MNYNDFAETIKQKHPEYKNVDNFTLAKKIIEKHPEYKGKVELLSPQEAKKYGVKPEYITPEYKAQIDKLEADKNTKVNKARVGAGLMIASPLITAFTGGLGLPATLGLMATEGGVYGLGEGLLKDDLSAKNIAKNAALGAGIGGVTAGAMKGVKAYKASRIAKVAKKADALFGDGFNERLFREQLTFYADINYSEQVEYLVPPPKEEDIKSFLTRLALQ